MVALAPAWARAQAPPPPITSRPRGKRRSHNHVPVGLILGVGSSGPMRGGKTQRAPHGTEPRAVHLPSRAASGDPAIAGLLPPGWTALGLAAGYLPRTLDAYCNQTNRCDR